MLVNGQWQKKWDPVQKQDKDGRFIRQTSSFRQRLDATSVARLKNGERPYTLYVALICPWATRVLIARSLFGLEDYLPVKIVAPTLTDYGWQFTDFPGATAKSEVEFNYMHELYTLSDPHFTGRATVPVLWDNEKRCIINNESADLLKILNDDLRELHQSDFNLRPESFSAQMDELDERIYRKLNNGVYQAGFAQSQKAYDEAYQNIFSMLDELEERLAHQRYLFGEQLSESDIRLFVTLARFDVAYYGIFKANRQRISDFTHLNRYFHDLIQIDAFAKNTNIEHIKTGYYSIKALNPTQIIPDGPDLDWFKYLN
ncbi:glutathione S-transferase family protein [Celerinatantimonas sp. MCCC 1A17872]|uniref:glutathione S-transferase family protein n=1 Tax=Celerinatantimonas sp. MCCC 1A17872 TaxID=3177514 RepID=UPI0038C903B7